MGLGGYLRTEKPVLFLWKCYGGHLGTGEPVLFSGDGTWWVFENVKAGFVLVEVYWGSFRNRRAGFVLGRWDLEGI